MNDETPDAGSELGPVHVTIVVTAGPGRRWPGSHGRDLPRGPGRRRAPLPPGRGSARGLVWAGGIVVAVAAAIVVGLTAAHSPPVSLARQIPATTRADSEATILGFRVDCPLLAIVSPDGRYARADYEMATPCGSYGNYVTVILRRVRGVWVRELVGTGWRCPSRVLPPRVLVELQLCPGTFKPSAPGVRPQRPAY